MAKWNRNDRRESAWLFAQNKAAVPDQCSKQHTPSCTKAAAALVPSALT